MTGTSVAEQKKRQQEFKKVVDRFETLIKEAKENDSILESQEYQEVSGILSLGPLYDYLLADIENPDYTDAFGEHPLNHKPIREEYNSGIYGKEVIFEGYGRGVVECLAYDYGDFYYKFIPEGKTDPVYITMVEKYESN